MIRGVVAKRKGKDILVVIARSVRSDSASSVRKKELYDDVIEHVRSRRERDE